MFGLGKLGRNGRGNQQPVNQLPYEVYETVQQPAYRRRRWIIRLVVLLIIVTALIFAGIAIRRALSNDNDSKTQNKNSQQNQTKSDDDSQSSNKDVLAPAAVNQDAQGNSPANPIAGQPATTPQSTTTNNSTVRKPN